MERRVAGIIRWLERCIKAYKDGAVESALMDAECARADMETLRGDLWAKAGASGRARKRRLYSLKAAEALFCALGIMLAAATPLALPQYSPAADESAGDSTSLEWVTPDEMELLINLRKSPDGSLAKAVTAEEPAAAIDAVRPPEPKPAQALVSVPSPARRKTPEPTPQPSERKEQKTSITYENILSLIETGERAMNNEPPVIMVENAGKKQR